MKNHELIAQLREQGLVVDVVHYRAQKKDNPDAISEKGGQTVVTILEGEEQIACGQAVTSRKDNYNRKLGTAIALGRAMKALDTYKQTGQVITLKPKLHGTRPSPSVRRRQRRPKRSLATAEYGRR